MPAKRELEGLQIVVTRPHRQGEGLAQALRSAGARPILMPAVRIEPREQVDGLENAIRQLERYDWAIFTSVNAVEILWDWLERLGETESVANGPSVAAIGPATAAALRERKVEPDFMPRDYVGEALAEGLPLVAGSRILLPRAAGSRPVLPQMLEARGAQVDEFALYRTVRSDPDPEAIEALRMGVDAITFTSPSTMRGFIEILREAGIDPLKLPGEPIVACIGPVTATASARAGLEPGVVAESYTVDGLIVALKARFREEVSV